MSELTPANRLDRPVDERFDHILGPPSAAITLVEYGSYACPYCRAANERIAEVRDQFGDRLRYVFRHRPLTGSELARRAAELVERAPDPKRFWDAHVKLMTRSEMLTEDDLVAVAARPRRRRPTAGRRTTRRGSRAKARVDADEASAARERRAVHADLLHQRPPLRRTVGRKLASPTRCWARSAIGCARRRSTSRAGGRRPACCCCSRR